MLKNPLFYAALAAGAVVFALLRTWSRWRKSRKQMEEMSQLKRRDEALNAALRDPLSKDAPRTGPEGPMEIKWDDKAVNEQGGSASLLIELIELSAYSRRKYVFRADTPIVIGSGENCRMVLPRDGVAGEHCEIRLEGKRACVRSIAGAKTILKRKKVSALVGTDGVYLNNGDHLQLGVSEIQFRMFKA